jgi:4'-phosphopantetheinyl transferase EntD
VIHPSPPQPWEQAFLVALPHGLCAGLHLPTDPDPVPAAVLARLHSSERAAAEALKGFRQIEFTGGRLALATLFGDLGARRAAVLSDEHGAPALPEGFAGSISHKRDLVVALLARGGPGVGIDIEETGRDRPGVAERVLCPDELEEVRQLPLERQWTDTVIRFSVKEALYKALFPFMKRYIGFGEVAVWPSQGGLVRIEPRVEEWSRYQIDARATWVGDRVLSTVRARPL